MTLDFQATLSARANGACELCRAMVVLQSIPVVPDAIDADRHVEVCAVCASQIAGGALDEKHWYCLKDAMWSEVPAVQVVAVRLLKRIGSSAWAQDLLAQVYLPDDLQAWVDADPVGSADDDVVTLDSNGTRLADGDAVTLIKDLDVKGAGFVAKRGTLVKGIRLIGDPENIEGRVNKTMLVLKTKFLKKASV